jgi:hypothetical protein
MYRDPLGVGAAHMLDCGKLVVQNQLKSFHQWLRCTTVDGQQIVLLANALRALTIPMVSQIFRKRVFLHLHTDHARMCVLKIIYVRTT